LRRLKAGSSPGFQPSSELQTLFLKLRSDAWAGDNAGGKSGIGELWVNLQERGKIA
jgi:hypothetical protein